MFRFHFLFMSAETAMGDLLVVHALQELVGVKWARDSFRKILLHVPIKRERCYSKDPWPVATLFFLGGVTCCTYPICPFPRNILLHFNFVPLFFSAGGVMTHGKWCQDSNCSSAAPAAVLNSIFGTSVWSPCSFNIFLNARYIYHEKLYIQLDINVHIRFYFIIIFLFLSINSLFHPF